MLTNCKSIEQFEDVYFGPEFMISTEHSRFMLICCVTFIYGPIFPILFPLAFCCFFARYTTERLKMAYSYKKPPNYNDSITVSTIKFLKYMPYLYLMSSITLLLNDQVFRSQTLKDSGSIFVYYHIDYYGLFTRLTPATPLLLVLIYFVCCDFIYSLIKSFYANLRKAQQDTLLDEKDKER